MIPMPRRQLLRVIMMLVVCITFVAIAFVMIWLQYRDEGGLPDLGDPREVP
jgi:hypothetical protein